VGLRSGVGILDGLSLRNLPIRLPAKSDNIGINPVTNKGKAHAESLFGSKPDRQRANSVGGATAAVMPRSGFHDFVANIRSAAVITNAARQ